MHKLKINNSIIVKFIIPILFLIWFILTIYIFIDLAIHINNISEYFIYLKTGIDINELNNFTLNANDVLKESYYTYLNNLKLYPPIGVTEDYLLKIDYMLKISFIPVYNWIRLIVISIFDFLVFVTLIFLLIKTRKYYVDKIKYI